MGCNRCKQKKVMNNLHNVDYINEAKKTYKEIIVGKSIDEYTDLDKVMIMNTYTHLYPASSAVPSLEDAINQIKIGIEVYDVKYRR